MFIYVSAPVINSLNRLIVPVQELVPRVPQLVPDIVEPVATSEAVALTSLGYE